MSELARLDLSYAGRIDHISGRVAGGLNGAFVFASTTVFDDSRAVDALWGGSGTDWLIYGQRDDLKDRIAAGTATRI